MNLVIETVLIVRSDVSPFTLREVTTITSSSEIDQLAGDHFVCYSSLAKCFLGFYKTY